MNILLWRLLQIDRCFGFDTAVEEAQRALISAKVEASSAYRGVGLVKLMGRQSGFLSVNASLASGVVDVCLIPEVPFTLHGPNGLLAYIEKLLAEKGHAVICVAEGAGQDILASGEQKFDASGNPVLKNVGLWLKSEIKAALPDVDMKYIDPSKPICVAFLSMNDAYGDSCALSISFSSSFCLPFSFYALFISSWLSLSFSPMPMHSLKNAFWIQSRSVCVHSWFLRCENSLCVRILWCHQTDSGICFDFVIYFLILSMPFRKPVLSLQAISFVLFQLLQRTEYIAKSWPTMRYMQLLQVSQEWLWVWWTHITCIFLFQLSFKRLAQSILGGNSGIDCVLQ